MIREFVLRTLRRLGYQLVRLELPSPPGTSDVPDIACYRPFFCPCLRDAEFNDVYSLVAPTTIVSVDRCYVLWTLAQQALATPGEFVECGVYQGGTARLLAEVVSRRRSDRHIHLFDTFGGMPETDVVDLHKPGDFVDTSIRRVKRLVGHDGVVFYHPGHIPETFAGLNDVRIALAHVDVDVYQSVLDCCEFIYPRLVPGGVMIFDDYGFQSCPGARRAVDTFFAE